MYIKNFSNIPQERLFRCEKPLATWLINTKHMPILAIDGKEYIFARTRELEKALKDAPILLKIIDKF